MADSLHYYDGFRTFSWFADFVGLPIDQANFVITQFIALLLAGLFRSSLSHKVVKPATRHWFGLTIGLALGYFCFGRQAIHLVGLPVFCYTAMRTQNAACMQRAVLVVALAYLSTIHIHRQLYDYGSYTLDITGPLMVITQKVTSLAYSLHDGLARNKEELTPLQRRQAVYKMPTMMEYFSYVFHFQALMAGPVIFYRDYIDFINGDHMKDTTKSLTDENNEKTLENVNEIVLEPSPMKVVVKKVIASLMCAALFVSLIPLFSIQKLKDDDFLQETLFYKLWYIIVVTSLVRFKYYYAWIFADAICNNSGLGFDGYKEDGEPRWDKFANVNIIQFEASLNLRDSITNWNMGTNRWLRSMVYDRVKRQKVIFTYALSALWHGFYPGYYFTFANGVFFTLAARNVRRYVRPFFLGSKNMKFFYDVMTFIITRIIMAYISFAFILLEFLPSIRLYLHMYLLPHLFGLVAIVIVPCLLSSRLPERATETSNKLSSDTSNVRNGNLKHKTM
ncbi:PREDICTED: lysophospholipid acyltransferase 1 [Polistes canadensis]|uniref:lysophospholipid acyltransferase 1 n=1 Tax=Polistes canadensis TaxID=91411 RepID=UPI000718F521|nr:PREDICTED: lysophospholipid acyltransferase 1 [Polistes canadensis]